MKVIEQREHRGVGRKLNVECQQALFDGLSNALRWTKSTHTQNTYSYNLYPIHDRTPLIPYRSYRPPSNPIEHLSDDEPTWAEAKIKRPNPLARWVSRLCCRGCCACMCTAPDQGISDWHYLIDLISECECGMWTSRSGFEFNIEFESDPIGSATLSVSLSCCCSWSCS